LVVLDDSNKAMEALDSLKLLQNKPTQKQLAKSGMTVSSLGTQEPKPRPSSSKDGNKHNIETCLICNYLKRN